MKNSFLQTLLNYLKHLLVFALIVNLTVSSFPVYASEIVVDRSIPADQRLTVDRAHNYDGNTRILILQERGFDVNTLPREILK